MNASYSSCYHFIKLKPLEWSLHITHNFNQFHFLFLFFMSFLVFSQIARAFFKTPKLTTFCTHHTHTQTPINPRPYWTDLDPGLLDSPDAWSGRWARAPSTCTRTPASASRSGAGRRAGRTHRCWSCPRTAPSWTPSSSIWPVWRVRWCAMRTPTWEVSCVALFFVVFGWSCRSSLAPEDPVLL